MSLRNWVIVKLGGVPRDEHDREVKTWEGWARTVENLADGLGAIRVLDDELVDGAEFSVPVIMRSNVRIGYSKFEAGMKMRPDSKRNYVSNCCFQGSTKSFIQ